MSWVFGFGSLMWEPGFPCAERAPATLRGYHRAFCLKSTKNRGTPEHPGLMLSLMPGGACTGVAYRLAASEREAALAYLDKREGEGKANRRVLLPVRLVGARSPVLENAWSYLPVVSHPNWLGSLPLPELLPRFCVGPGEIGTGYEYLEHLLRELAAIGAREPALEELKAEVDAYRANEGGAGCKPAAAGKE